MKIEIAIQVKQLPNLFISTLNYFDRDMCPVVTMQNSGGYELIEMKNGYMSNLVFENYVMKDAILP